MAAGLPFICIDGGIRVGLQGNAGWAAGSPGGGRMTVETLSSVRMQGLWVHGRTQAMESVSGASFRFIQFHPKAHGGQESVFEDQEDHAHARCEGAFLMCR